MLIQLFSLRNQVSIDVSKLTEEEVLKLWNEIAYKSDIINACTNGCIRLINTHKTKNNFKDIVEHYEARIPQIKRLKYFLLGNKNVDLGAFFYVFNSKYSLLHERMAAIEVLKCENSNWNECVRVHNYTFGIWARISSEFEVLAFGIDGKKYIGECEKKNRVCRFCGESGKKYVNRSHAIPEAIGNKLLFCNEECDECNAKLKSVEENFIHLMDFRRSIHRISSKDCRDSHTIKGVNYTIAPDENGDATLYIKQSSKPKDRLPNGDLIYKFDHYDKVIDQDIYRALTKMVIDLVPSDRLPHFYKTIEWIRKKSQDIIPDALPSILIGELPEGNMFEQPILYMFFRREGEIDIPYCTAMLFTTDIAYQFVVPFVDVDEGRFKYDEDLTYSRNRICKTFNIKWTLQQFYSWWRSDIWNYWPVNLNAPNIKVRPDSDPIFSTEKRYTVTELNEFDKRLFHKDDVRNIQVGSLSAEKISELLKKSKQDKTLLEPREMHLDFRFNMADNKCQLSIRMSFEIGDSNTDFSIVLGAEIPRLKIISYYDRYITDSTFETLVLSVLRKAIHPINRIFGIKARKPGISILEKGVPYNVLRSSTIEFITPNGKLIKTNFYSLIE